MFSFAVTAYQELTPMRQNGKWLQRCIGPALAHPAIEEIVIVDDGSDGPSLAEFLADKPKVTTFRNQLNLGVFGNKLEAIARCGGEWVINCDSDNLMDYNYLEQICTTNHDSKTWYSPSFARPEFDYRNLIGLWDRSNICELLSRPRADCLLNTGNQLIHRSSFMDLFGRCRGLRADLLFPNWLQIPEGRRREHHWRLVFDALDSTVFNLYWMKSGGRLQVVEGMEYEHHYSSGQDSNYIRAPRDKERLSGLLTAEFMAMGGRA